MDRRIDSMTAQSYEQLAATLATLPPATAAERIEEFLRQQPDHAQAHNDLGVLQYQLGNHTQALGRYERAVKLAPHNSTFRKNLASFYFVELGWTDEAIQIYTDLLRDHPEDIDVLSALALISNTIGQEQEALTFLERIISLQPDNQDALAMLAALHAPEAAAPPPGTAAQDDPSELDALLADLHQSIAGLTATAPAPPMATGQAPAAVTPLPTDPRIAELEQSLRSDPTNALLHNDLGVLYFEQGNRELSLSHHEMACRYAPDNLIFVKNLAGICACSPDTLDRAISLLTTALAKFPTDIELLGALGNLSLQCARPDEALIFLRRILDFEPWNQEARTIVMQLQDPTLKDFFLTP
jgi:cytochrome c-type biogenesis protein CcmH/NrfG